MKKKSCNTCKKEKSLLEFNKNKTKKDGLQTICKVCSRARSKKYYKENKEKHRKVVYKLKQKRIKEHRIKLLKFLKDNSCVDCGESDPIVLEFDHVRGKKKSEVTRLVINGYSWSNILKEIKKCDIRCTNCHRRKTYTESNSWRIMN